MKRIKAPFVDRSVCQNALRETDLGPELVLGDSVFCAGGVGTPGPCLVRNPYCITQKLPTIITINYSYTVLL